MEIRDEIYCNNHYDWHKNDEYCLKLAAKFFSIEFARVEQCAMLQTTD